MRLIDADALIKRFETIQKQEQAIGLDFVAIIDEIKEQQTAYDVDKVVKELEEKENEAVLKAPKTSDITNQEYQKWMMKSYGFKESIEIVKNGGVDDVCEWKKDDKAYDWEPGCEPNSRFNVNGVGWFKYCPYCGKKIKVVE